MVHAPFREVEELLRRQSALTGHRLAMAGQAVDTTERLHSNSSKRHTDIRMGESTGRIRPRLPDTAWSRIRPTATGGLQPRPADGKQAAAVWWPNLWIKLLQQAQ